MLTRIKKKGACNMEKLMGYTTSELETLKAIHTVKEIYQQPDVWFKVWSFVKQHKEQIQVFMDRIQSEKNVDIILTGAGTSAFAGEVVEPILHTLVDANVRAIASTDIVANPLQYLSPNKPTVLISYARSGNSPESVAAVNLANQQISNVYHIVITCNEQGALAKMAQADDKTLLLLMPSETNDQSFAMTSSCTSMILTNLFIFNLEQLDTFEIALQHLKENLTTLFTEQTALDELAASDFSRIIYLGSGASKGIAREMALKMLELTAGQVNANYDTPLGFRHGPKSVIHQRTVTVVLRQNEAYAAKYDDDLIDELQREQKENKVVILRNDGNENGLNFKHVIEHPVLLGLQYLVFGQLLSVKKSLHLGITPDNPCPTGEVNRVVKGVTIYPF